MTQQRDKRLGKCKPVLISYQMMALRRSKHQCLQSPMLRQMVRTWNLCQDPVGYIHGISYIKFLRSSPNDGQNDGFISENVNDSWGLLTAIFKFLSLVGTSHSLNKQKTYSNWPSTSTHPHPLDNRLYPTPKKRVIYGITESDF